MVGTINLKTFTEFLKSGTAGGFLLLSCLVISLLVANSAIGVDFEKLLATEIGYQSNNVELRYSILLWINDGLMAVFFLLVGLEIKRELIEGELASFKQATLPVFAAVGGMAVPAILYGLVNSNTATAAGWGIPMATDIAFAIAILSLLGSRVPSSLKVFLTALAIVDDLGAILVIALFYSSDIQVNYLLYSGGILLVLIAFNLVGIKNLIFYLIPGLFMWYFIHHSGVHATVAGVLTALTIPTTPDAKESALEKLEHALTKPVNFLIMPLFALANTNIRFESQMLDGLVSNLGLGIMLGLLLGKPIGITLMAWIAVKIRVSTLPDGVTWSQVAGLGLVAGIGFTMSIFIALLSFNELELQTAAKFSILIASALAGIFGFLLLNKLGKKSKRNQAI